MDVTFFRNDIAVKYGVYEAILFQNIQYWVKKNMANDKNFYTDRYWTYNSYKAFQELLPYLSNYQIRQAIKNLETAKMIGIGNFNKLNYDRTSWYCIEEEGLKYIDYNPNDRFVENQQSNVRKPQMEDAKTTNGCVGFEQPIPNIYTNIYTNKKTKDIDDDVQGQAAPLSSTSNFKYIDSDLKYDNKVMQALDFYFNGYVSPTTYEVLEKSKLSDDLKIYAIKKCDMAKSYNANYLRAILYSLETKGIKTIEKAEAEDNKFMQAKQNKSNDYLATKNRELDLREKELEYKKANQPNYQKMVELQYEKSQQKKQQQEDSKNQEELKAKYHDDYIAGKIERAKLKELGVSEWNLMLWDVEIYDNQPGQKEINEAWEKHKAKQYEKEKERKKWR